MDKLWGEYVIMMNVSNELKELYRSGNGRKKLNISISGSETTITNSNIVSESMSIKQSLSDDENIKLGSCNSSSFEITVAGITEDLIGKEIQPKLLVDSDTTELSLGLFTVESSKKEVGRPFRKITAYDRMKKLSVDVGEWYRGLVFPVTVKDLRDGLCGHVGLEQLETTLPFDSMEINKTLDDDGAINGLDLMQGICELNGCFGNISKDGKFEYVYLSTGDPVDTLNGILKSYPQCEDYKASAINGVTIKFTDSDIIYQSTSHTNSYIITDNYLIADKTEEELISIANTIARKINGISYRPATIESVGQPYFDLGDKVSFNDESGSLDTTYILKREINGIQALTDSIEASGDEYIQQDVNSVVGQLAKLNSDNGRLKIKIAKTEEGLSLKVSKGDVSSQLSVETDQIVLKGNRLIVDSSQLKLDENGNIVIDTNQFKINTDENENAEFSGNIIASSGQFTKGFQVKVPYTLNDKLYTLESVSDLGCEMSCYSTDNDYGRPSQLSGIICGFGGEVSIYGTSKISVNGKDISTLSTTNITNTDNIKSGALTLHKRYNSVTITCNVSATANEFETAAGYVVLGTLPEDCIPNYNIIEYHRLNGAYVGQISINTSGQVRIGYTKNNSGNAINLPVTAMYWAFTYTI
nr:MAG TPA: hypothetical protein [Caudoviricetes sp.]